MTADEVKECHDRIWAVRKKISLRTITIAPYISEDNFRIDIQYNAKRGLPIYSFRYHTFTTKTEVNQFLKELP